MTELLRKAVATLSKLPPEKQDVLAAMVLEEIACEQGPSHLLSSIEALEEEARQEYLAGKTGPMSYYLSRCFCPEQTPQPEAPTSRS